MNPLSAVIITKNEEANIGRCLDSLVGLADDVVVIDSFSIDSTVEIAEKRGARVILRQFDDFMGQKNFGIEQARFPLVLSLDADECPDEMLRQSIQKAKENPSFDGWRMNMLTNYCGTWIRHSGWYPDPKLRLFDTRKGRWAGKNPHEKFTFFAENTPVGQLDGHLLHFSYPTVESHLRKAEFYSTIGAEYLVASGRRVGWLAPWTHAAAKWFKEFVWLRGFLDGRAGWTIARISAWATFLKYQKARRIADSGLRNSD